MKTRINLKYFRRIVACCLYFTFFYNNAHNYVSFPRSNLMHCLKVVSMMLKLCYNHILTLCFWGSVLQWSTLKTKYPNFTFFQHFYIPTMVKHVVKGNQKLVSVVNHGIKDYPHIVAFERIAYNGLPLYSFFRNEWFTMGNLLLPWLWQWLTMFLLHYGYILDHEYGIKKDDHELTMGNHAQPWKHGFHYSWVGCLRIVLSYIYIETDIPRINPFQKAYF